MSHWHFLWYHICVTILTSSSFNTDDLNMPNNITLADPSFNRSSNIDAIIGASLF